MLFVKKNKTKILNLKKTNVNDDIFFIFICKKMWILIYERDIIN